MKIYLQGEQQNKFGGGWSFRSNLKKCFAEQIVDNPEDCDIYFITSVSMLDKLSSIPKNKKIVLRVDNILKKSCNRDIYPFEGDKVSMMEAMRILAQRADLVVYQSEWSKDLLNSFLKPNRSTVILNSADESIFNPDGCRIPTDKEVYFYSRSSNHDNKQWHKAYYAYQSIHRSRDNCELWITGRFSPENIPNNFDFFNGESVKYMGFVTDPEVMATYFRTAKHYLYTYAFDSCSNTAIEAALCGTDIMWGEISGGAYEIKDHLLYDSVDYFKLPRMRQEYKEALNGII